MKKYVVDESILIGLLRSEMWIDCLERDGVDNWQGYGISYLDVIKDYTPNGVNLSEEAVFDDVALARLASGEFEELKENG